MSESSRRKLAVILHADVVGSTNLVKRDETLAHARIQDVFHRFSETIELYGGTTSELRGDALVAEFSRASDAVCAAVAFQTENGSVNDTLEDDIRPQLRIGIAMGEVVIADNTVTGAGVVLAQRLEQLAEPGSVCIQGAAYETVPQRLPFKYKSLGEQKVKGFEEPVRAHAVTLRPGEAIPSPEPHAMPVEVESERPKRQWIAVGAIAVLIIVGGGLAWLQPWKPQEEPAVARMAFPLPDKPSIAVLPFTNMSGDREQAYFADGITEDLITDLAKFPALAVASGTSSKAYQETTLDAREIGRELGVGYLLEGSVERTSDQLRITAQLIDATNGEHLWAERYDRALTDLFEVRDEIRAAIVGAMTGHTGPLFTEEHRRARKDDGTRLQARDLYYRANASFVQFTKEGNLEARRLLQEAIALDPEDAAAHALLAWTYWRDVWVFAIDEPKASIDHALAAAKKAATLDSNDYRGPWALGGAYRLLGDKDAAGIQYQRAYQLNPNDPDLLADRGEFFIYNGRLEEAIAQLERAMALNPHYPIWYVNVLSTAYLRAGRYQDALDVASRRADPDISMNLKIVASHAQLGNTEKAKAAVDEILELDPEFSIATYLDILLEWEEPNEQLLEGLRKAGLPEE